MIRIRIARAAFLAEKRDLGKSRVQPFLDQILATNIEFQFDVMRSAGVYFFRSVQIFADDHSGGAGGINSGS